MSRLKERHEHESISPQKRANKWKVVTNVFMKIYFAGEVAYQIKLRRIPEFVKE